MCNKINIETFVALAALFIAIVTIYYSNKNNKQQIRTGKLEELFQTTQSLSRNYGLFMEFWFKVQQLRDSNDKEIETLADYYKERDKKISNDKRNEILELLSRIEVLAECYTTGDLKENLLKYENLMYSFFDLVTNGGSIQQEINWKNGFPTYEDFFKMTQDLKSAIVNEIKK